MNASRFREPSLRSVTTAFKNGSRGLRAGNAAAGQRRFGWSASPVDGASSFRATTACSGMAFIGPW